LEGQQHPQTLGRIRGGRTLVPRIANKYEDIKVIKDKKSFLIKCKKYLK